VLRHPDADARRNFVDGAMVSPIDDEPSEVHCDSSRREEGEGCLSY
jgi:hypothetical protein